MPKFAWMVALVAFASPVMAQTAPPDLRGTWKGESLSIILGGSGHHPRNMTAAPRLGSVPFTLVIDNQDGRRFSGTFSSPRHTEPVIAVMSQSGAIYVVDDDGYTVGTMLAPNRMELCYMHLSPASRIASCAELTKQP